MIRTLKVLGNMASESAKGDTAITWLFGMVISELLRSLVEPGHIVLPDRKALLLHMFFSNSMGMLLNSSLNIFKRWH